MTIKDIRRKVMQIGNRLYKRGFSRIAALETAWRLIKCRRLETRVAGTTFNGRQGYLALLAKFHPSQIAAKLVRDQHNSHDPNAVAVVATAPSGEYLIGYLPQAVAAVVAAVLDKGLTIATKQLRIVGGYSDFQNYGARISVAM